MSPDEISNHPMRTTRIHSIIASLAICSGGILAAQQTTPPSEPCFPPTAKAAPGSDVARYIRLADKSAVQVPCQRLKDKQGRTIELTGVVHVADRSYFEALDKHLKGFDAVLFELVGDETDVEAARKKQPSPHGVSPMSKIYTFMAHEVLGMVTQGEVIDYNNPKFIHADLSEAEINELLKPHNMSIDELLSGPMKGTQMDLDQMESMLPMMKSMMPKGDPHAIKRMIAPAMTDMEGGCGRADCGEGSLFHEIVVVKRNARALEVLDRELAAGKKKVSIFYGSAHMPDFKKRLLEQGWQEDGVEWRDAWTIPVLAPAAAVPNPAKEASASPDAEAEALLENALGIFSKAKAYQFTAKTCASISGFGNQQEMVATAEVKVMQPNFLFVRAKDAQGKGGVLYSDGSTVTLMSDGSGRYHQMPAPATLSGFASLPGLDEVGLGPSNDVLRFLDSGAAAVGGFSGMPDASRQEAAELDGALHERVKITFMDMHATFWIKKDAAFPLTRIDIDPGNSLQGGPGGPGQIPDSMAAMLKMEAYQSFSSTAVVDHYPIETFRFVPPAGTTAE